MSVWGIRAEGVCGEQGHSTICNKCAPKAQFSTISCKLLYVLYATCECRVLHVVNLQVPGPLP